MRDRLADVFKLLEDGLASVDAPGNENVKQSEQTAIAAGWDNFRTRSVNDRLNPIMKDDVTPAKARQTSGTEKSIRRPTTCKDQSSADLPAFLKPPEGNEPLEANQIDWNRVAKMDSESTVYTRQNTVIVRKSTSGTLPSAVPIELAAADDRAIEVIPISDVNQTDTPCPSRRASCSSSSSSSSSSSLISVQGRPEEDDDERFFQTCTDAALLASRRPSATSTISILGGSITAKVSFVQQTTSTGSAADPVDLQCLVTKTTDAGWRGNNSSVRDRTVT